MKWENPNGAVQHTTDHRYAVVQATEGNWIAYRLHLTIGEDLGVAHSDERARQLCEAHDLQAVRKSA